MQSRLSGGRRRHLFRRSGGDAEGALRVRGSRRRWGGGFRGERVPRVRVEHTRLDPAALAVTGRFEADVDLAGALADWTARLSVVRDEAVPLPEPLAALLVEITEQLTATAAATPLAALRAVGVLERIAARVGREAVGAVGDDGMSAEAVATALGTTRSKALVLLLTAQDRHQGW
ncbi:hypothetical protein ACIQZO_39245 [Streptomyces sp. NPDC097617]|uniref:hypothetical protein n=1 Tax=Streptomyces sp. NPDC097617 TaxID=3366091 RepID=UPI0038264D75